MMNGPEKSDSVVVAGKPTNKAERSAAELVERRAGTKGNAAQQSTRRTQSWISVSQALERMRQRAAVDTRGGSRMRESRTYGSVRGARGNSRPYREHRLMAGYVQVFGRRQRRSIHALRRPASEKRQGTKSRREVVRRRCRRRSVPQKGYGDLRTGTGVRG